uniref:Ubiquitin-like protease family profile domain-containing protein n=1 Tax=Parascaris univalens TaxID=6257 RepID=A0A915A7L7_PARUN
MEYKSVLSEIKEEGRVNENDEQECSAYVEESDAKVELASESDAVLSSADNSWIQSFSSVRHVGGKDSFSEESDGSHSSNSDDREIYSQRSDDQVALTNTPNEAQEDNEETKFKNRYVRMGERLTDDLINAYCDRLQEAVNKEVDGMLAMQYIMVITVLHTPKHSNSIHEIRGI